ncbi:surface antigen [Plasmodium falciparum UGT5.1]|uniref:Surface antigen n=1 Tax=Plasmodium falciparum UGT5.1 TaxID=1237627 RepID=W7JX84_PLAFA|nr:surface antigen [Plasmodium falciparum UGT5.1]
MKLDYSKILLLSLPLNILVSSSYANNKNKPYIKSHTAITTSRVLSECDINTSIYDNDPYMKSVKENFDRQASERFEEYDERMKDKRLKCKEQCKKDIQEIILKDKVEKSLSEKVEKGCLKCGCGLGSVAASVGIIGPIVINELKKAALIAATQAAMTESAAEGAVAGVEAGKNAVIAGLKQMGVSTLGDKKLVSYFTSTNYTNAINIARDISIEYQTDSCLITVPVDSKPICPWVRENFVSPGNGTSMYESIEIGVTSIVSDAEPVAAAAAQQATKDAIKASTLAVDSKYVIFQNAIIASVVAIIIIALVMIIIYLVLRYRRKKKMNKKQQYTKLLNQ